MNVFQPYIWIIYALSEDVTIIGFTHKLTKIITLKPNNFISLYREPQFLGR